MGDWVLGRLGLVSDIGLRGLGLRLMVGFKDLGILSYVFKQTQRPKGSKDKNKRKKIKQ